MLGLRLNWQKGPNAIILGRWGGKTRVSGGENKNEKSMDRNKSTLIWISIGGIEKNNTFCLQNKAHKHETTRTRTGRLVMRAKTLSPLVSLIWWCFVVCFFSNKDGNRGGFSEHLVHHSVQFEESTTNTA